MAFTNLFDYPSASDVLDMGNNVYSDVLDASARQNHIAFTYPFGPTGNSEVLALSSAPDGGPFPTYPGSVPENVAPTQSTSEALESLDFFRVFQGPDTSRRSCPQTEQNSEQKPSPGSQSPTPASKKRPYKFRKQNRCCDPCRSAKRACDLPLNTSLSDNLPLTPCSMCKLRGTDCTIAWRSTKQASRNTKDAAPNKFVKSYVTRHDLDATEESNEGLYSPIPSNLPSHDCTLVCRTMASQTCVQKLEVYNYVFDSPISRLLSDKCMPPRYSLGIAAIMPLRCNTQLTAQFNQTQSSITNAWGERPPSQLPTPTSRLFLTASILDTLFERPSSRSEHVQFMPRDVALAETYKWVAIATGSQFLVDGSSANNKEKPSQQARDIAYATWCKAKHMVFENIAASKSFRLGLTLILFGTILPPSGTDRSDDFQEEAAYALHEGVRRLHILCYEARACLQTSDTRPHIMTPISGLHKPMKRQFLFQKLTPDARENVVELIAAFEWLSEISESVAIALSPFRRLSLELSSNDSSSENPQVENFFFEKSDVKNVQNIQNLKRIDDGIIARVKAVTLPVTELWIQGSEEQVVLDAVLESGSFVAIMWKALARFTIATKDWGIGYITDAKIHEHFNTMIMLIDLWRTTFGTIDCDSAKSLHLSPADVRRSVTFCATDGDLAILLFYELCCRLEKDLEDQPQRPRPTLCETLKVTKNNRDHQRLKSAMQLFYLASANFQVSSPRFQEKCGLKANFEYIRAHPHPTMVVQAYQLASEGLAQEIQNSVSTIDLKRISELSTALECCLRELQGLQNALIMYPAISKRDANETFP